MFLIPAFLFAFSANLDSLILGISYGIRRTRLRFFDCLLSGLVIFFGTGISLLPGNRLLQRLPLSAADTGSILLTFFGLYYIIKFVFCPKDIPDSASPDSSDVPEAETYLTPKKCLLLGLTLSVNNFGIGIGAGISGLLPVPALLASFGTSVLFLWSGNRLGIHCISHIDNRCFDLLSGIILLILGLYQLI